MFKIPLFGLSSVFYTSCTKKEPYLFIGKTHKFKNCLNLMTLVLVACICIFSFDFPRREADRLIIQSCSVHQFCKFYLRFTGFVCANALPATDFDVLLQRPSRRTLLAFEATFLLVCFEFFIIAIPPFYRFSCYTPRNLIQFTVKMYLMR